MEVHFNQMFCLIFMGFLTLLLFKDTNEPKKQIQKFEFNVCNRYMKVAPNSFNTARLRKRTSIDLNRSPPRSPSQGLNDAREVSSSNRAEPNTNQEGYDSPATAKKKKRRAQIAKSVKKYFARYTEKSRVEAEKKMSAEEYASYLITYDRIKKKNNERDRKYAVRQKNLREKGDLLAHSRYAKRLARNRKSYSERKSKKDAQKKQNDMNPDLTKRANVDAAIEKHPTKKRQSYHAKFTKKAEEEARKTLSDSDYKEYKVRLDRFREKRSGYGKSRNIRIKEARKAGDPKKIKVYTHHLEIKKTKYKQNSIGVFLASDSLSDHHRQQARGNDGDLYALLQQPLDQSIRKHVEMKLADRQRSRNGYKEKVDLAKDGDPTAKEWLERKRKSSRIATAKYKKAKREARLRINDLARKTD